MPVAPVAFWACWLLLLGLLAPARAQDAHGECGTRYNALGPAAVISSSLRLADSPECPLLWDLAWSEGAYYLVHPTGEFGVHLLRGAVPTDLTTTYG